jgi:hypothetical protein
MITVRFPRGLVVQYNTATFIEHDEHGSRLFTKENGKQIARIQHSAGAIIEFNSPCRVYDSTQKIENEKIAELAKEICSLKTIVRKSGVKK